MTSLVKPFPSFYAGRSTGQLYVIHSSSDRADNCIDQAQAISEFRTLVHDLTEAGLRVQIRHGHGSALLVCIRVPRDHLGKMVHQSRYDEHYLHSNKEA
jgi:hypothetical protein